jgi:hypothetical protein
MSVFHAVSTNEEFVRKNTQLQPWQAFARDSGSERLFLNWPPRLTGAL